MRSTLTLMICALFFGTFLNSCQEDNSAASEKLVSQEVLDQIDHLGFSHKDVQKIEEGYLVEGDIILTEADLQDRADHITLRIAETEQYHTNNLVTGLPRTITVSIDSKLTNIAGYSDALNIALTRLNIGLQLTFVRVSGSGGQIHLKKQTGNFLASAGFPSGGDPYPLIKMNSNAIGSGNTDVFKNFCASIMDHEIGHCIGFRHTDWMDRSYSCGVGGSEGAGSVGAVHIPGTPTGPDSGSCFLACFSINENRPFNNNDKVALNYLY